MNMAIERVREVIGRAWNQGELDMLDDAVTAQYTRFVPGEEVRGAEGFKARIAAVRLAMPDFHCHIDSISAEGDRGVVHWTSTGTHEGELLGISPSMNRLRWSGLTVFETVNGRLSREWELYDVQEFMGQVLGSRTGVGP